MIKRFVGVMALLTITVFCLPTMVMAAKASEPKPIGLFATITSHYEEQDGTTTLFRQHLSEVRRVEEYDGNYSEMFRALDLWNTEEKKQMYSRRKKMIAAARGHLAEAPEYFHGYYDSQNVTVNRADSTAVSLLTLPADYMGGAHGMYGKYGVNFDTATGEKLKLSDVFGDVPQTAAVILERLYERYGTEPFFDHTAEKVEKALAENTVSWTLDNDGATFYFNPYELAPYAAGILSARVYFAFDKGLFKDKYRVTPAAYVLPIDDALPLVPDGQISFVKVAIIDGKCRVSAGEEEVLTDGNYSDEYGMFIHRSNGQNFVWVDVKNGDTDVREILVYALAPKLRYVGTLKRTFIDPDSNEHEQRRLWMTNPDGFMLYKNVTLKAESKTDIGSVGEDGMLVFG